MLTSPTSRGIVGSAGNGLSGRLGTSGDVGTATCLKPALRSTCGVLGRDGEPIDGVPMKPSPFILLPARNVPFVGGGDGGAGAGSTLSTE